MSEEDSQVFRGDGHTEDNDGILGKSKKPTPKPSATPASAAPIAVPAPEVAALAPEAAAAPISNLAEQDMDFTVDKSSLWQMTEEMKTRVNQMASMSASTNQQLDMQEKNLRKLQKKNK